MGFLVNAAKWVGKQMQAKMERVNKYKQQYERYDDYKLMRLYDEEYGERKAAIGMVLRERGYDPE